MFALEHLGYCSPAIIPSGFIAENAKKQYKLVDYHCLTCSTRYPLPNGWDVVLVMVAFTPSVSAGVSLSNGSRLQLIDVPAPCISERGGASAEKRGGNHLTVTAETMFL